MDVYSDWTYLTLSLQWSCACFKSSMLPFCDFFITVVLILGFYASCPSTLLSAEPPVDEDDVDIVAILGFVRSNGSVLVTLGFNSDLTNMV